MVGIPRVFNQNRKLVLYSFIRIPMQTVITAIGWHADISYQSQTKAY